MRFFIPHSHCSVLSRSSDGRLSLAKRSNLGQPGVECLIANTVFSFVDKEEPRDNVKTQVENTEKKWADVVNNKTKLINKLTLENQETRVKLSRYGQ